MTCGLPMYCSAYGCWEKTYIKQASSILSTIYPRKSFYVAVSKGCSRGEVSLRHCCWVIRWLSWDAVTAGKWREEQRRPGSPLWTWAFLGKTRGSVSCGEAGTWVGGKCSRWRPLPVGPGLHTGIRSQWKAKERKKEKRVFETNTKAVPKGFWVVERGVAR